MSLPVYIVIESTELTKLEWRVEDLLKTGYQPVGGVSITIVGSGAIHYAQAMMKTAETPRTRKTKKAPE